MSTTVFRAPLAALPLALLAATSSLAQTSAATLATTVVSATRFSEPADTLPLGVSVITADDIRAAGVATVNEAVMRLLGVPGRQDLYGGGDYALDLRGFGSTADNNQVVVLDGIRLNEADLGGTRLAGIPIDTVERIEVLRGSGAVLYGEGATGGVIVITTKAGNGSSRRNAASAFAGVGSNGLREWRGTATLAAGGFSLDVAGQRRASNNHRDNFRSEVDGASASAQWSNDNVRLGARHARDALDTRLPGSLSAAQYAANPRQSVTPNDWARISNTASGLFGEVLLGNWQIAADLGWREKSLSSNQGGFAYAYDVEASQQSLRARHEATWGGLRHALVLGHDRGEWERVVAGAFGSTARQTTSAWYLKDDWTLAGGTRLSAGARTEQLRKGITGSADLDDRRNAWELGVSQPLSGNATLWGRIGSSFRLANVDEFSYTDPATAIRPQTSRDLEAGLRWVHGTWRTELRAYRSQLTDEIGYDPAGNGPWGPGTGANVNFDPTRRQGLELDAQWKAGPALKLSVNAALRQATFRSGPYAGRDVPLAPGRTVSLRADWTPATGHLVTAGLNWVGEQHPDFANQCRMPSYTTLDARYAYQWRQVEFSLGVRNLFDRDYYTRAFACVAGVTSAIYPEAGRTFTAAMRVAF